MLFANITLIKRILFSVLDVIFYRVLEQHMAQANLGMRTAFDVFNISLKERYEITDLVVSAANLFLSSLWDGQLMYQDVKLTPQLQIELKKCVEYHHSSLRGTIHILLTWLERRFDFFQVHYVKRSLEVSYNIVVL